MVEDFHPTCERRYICRQPLYGFEIKFFGDGLFLASASHNQSYCDSSLFGNLPSHYDRPVQQQVSFVLKGDRVAHDD